MGVFAHGTVPAPLLIVDSLYNPGKATVNVFGQAVPNIPVQIFQLSESPDGLPAAWGAAFVLLFLILMANIGARAMLGLPAKPFPVDWSKLVFKMLTIKCIYGREMFETWHKMIAMLQSGLDVRKVITHRMPVRDYLNGFETMRSGQSGTWSGFGKVSNQR